MKKKQQQKKPQQKKPQQKKLQQESKNQQLIPKNQKLVQLDKECQESQQKKISYSEFKTWTECPYRHKLIYIDKLPYYSGNEYTAFGTAIHEACEKKIPEHSVDAYKVFQESFLRELKILKEEGHNIDGALVQEMRKQALPICNNALKELKSYFGEFEVISIEESLMEDIEDFDSRGRKFKGFIDLVIKTPDEKYHIIDWKTCSWGWNISKKTDKIVNYQLTMYKHFFSKKHDVAPNNIETYFALLKRTAKKDNVEIFRVTSGEKKTNNCLSLLEKSVINIEKGIKVKNRLSCKYCKFYKTENCT